MQIQYYKAAWGDIKNSPGWFGKFCLLALINFIPVFGQIVTFGYLFGWAREIAWGAHQPMPAKIFANEDGKFWRRGWFVLVLAFVFALVPAVVVQIGNVMQSAGLSSYAAGYGAPAVQNPFLLGFGSLIALIGWAGAILLTVLSWVGSMRISIYDRLSAGFQISKIWKMARYDAKGLLKIFGMYLLVSLIIGVILGIIVTVLVFLVVAVGFAGLVGAGYTYDTLQHMNEAQAIRLFAQFISSAGLIGVLSLLAMTFLTELASVYVTALFVRAMGYWTMQFDVPRWGGQDDPLPFEGIAAAPPAAQPGYYAAPGTPQSAAPAAAPQPAAPAQPMAPAAGAAQPLTPVDVAAQPVGAVAAAPVVAQVDAAEGAFPAAEDQAIPVEVVEPAAEALDSAVDAAAPAEDAAPVDAAAPAEEGGDN